MIPRAKLTTAQAARYLGVSQRQMERMRGDGTGPIWFKAGDAINSPCMYEVGDLDVWVRTQKALPARIPLPETLCFEDICERLRAAAVEDTWRTYTENSFFCRSTYRFDGRFLLVRMENFQKADFDAVKKRVNHAVNREFHLPQRYAAGELAYKMRFYILYTEAANDELMRHISRNAETLLRRAEGVMTFVLCGDSLIVPPLYGDADTAAVRRYAGAIRMMRDLLRHPRAH